MAGLLLPIRGTAILIWFKSDGQSTIPINSFCKKIKHFKFLLDSKEFNLQILKEYSHHNVALDNDRVS
jgi:hypothetical protein